MEGESMNESIQKMVKILKSTLPDDTQVQDFTFSGKESNNKRALESSSSTESSFDGFSEPSQVKKLKKDSNFDVSYVGSPREVRRIRSDLIDARNTILNLENRIQHMHSVRKEMQIMFDNETRALKRQHEHDAKTITELENQLQTVRKRERDLKQELANLRNQVDVQKLNADEKIEELERTLSEQCEESRVYNGEENAEVAMLKRKVLELENELQAAEEDADAQRKISEDLSRQLAEKSAALCDMEMKEQELQKAKLKIKEFEFIKDNYAEYQEQAKTQAHKLLRYVELEKENEQLQEENAKIKDQIRNKLLLEEEVYDLKIRLARFKDQEAKFAKNQMIQVQQEMYLEEWRAVARGICESTGSDSSLPHLLRSAVERLQQQELFLTEEKMNLQSQLTTALHEVKVAKDEMEKIQKLLEKQRQMDSQKQQLIHRMQKKLLLISRERDSYRLQLDSYERDLSVCINTTNIGTSAATQLQSQKDRIDNLEKIVSGYRDMIIKLETDLEKAEPRDSDLAPIKLDQIARAQDEIKALKQENDRLRERKDQLEIQLEECAVGNDTLRGGQVFHMANNPLSECLQEREKLVERLESEVVRLKRKVKNLEDGLEASKLGDITISTAEVLELRDKIKGHESQMQYLKDQFKTSIRQFRDVVYLLFGYKIDRSPTSRYTLSSIYAEREEDTLCFQLQEDGDLEFLENQFSATLENLIDLHLRHQHSIPVFLSTITIDLFTNKTMTAQIS